jgi:hypothetical protein
MSDTFRLTIINDALANTANNLVSAAQLATVPNEASFGSAEDDADYIADRAARAYDRELRLLLARHPWNFALATENLEQADEDDNPSNRFGYAYDWPYDALWLQKVEEPGGLAIPYEIVGRFICMDYDGTEDTADAPVATFVQVPYDANDLNDLFKEILRVKVEVGILRAVNEDYGEASRRDKEAEGMLLPMARTRTDQQTPPRRAFRSSILERRRAGGGPRAL